MIEIEGLRKGRPEAGVGDGSKPSAKQEKRERLAGIEIADLNLGSGKQLEDILAILRHPSNADHIADITPTTNLKDIIDYYAERKRTIKRIAFNEDGEVVGVYDIFGIPPSHVDRLSPEERSGVSIVSGILNRLCIKFEERNKGIGSKLIEDGERQAFREYGFPLLRAAIVLSEEQMDFYKSLTNAKNTKEAEDIMSKRNIELTEEQVKGYKDAENEGFTQRQKENRLKISGIEVFLDWLALTDPRGRVFIKERGWDFNTIFEEQTRVESTGKNHSVLIVEKRKSKWDEEQRENKRPRHKKVIDVAKRVPKGVDEKLL